MTQPHPTRRDVLRIGGAAAASLILSPVRPIDAAAWKTVPIGTQLWCVRKQLASDVPGTLKAIASIGFEAVELENAFGTSGAEWRTLQSTLKTAPSPWTARCTRPSFSKARCSA